jgi:predicted nucleic acid-binding protein
MPDIIIADTTCFIILSKINELQLLKDLYGTIYTTVDIASEFNSPLPEWVIIRHIADDQKKQILELQIDKGEASAIALALEIPKSVVVLDDLKARILAEKLGINITGTIGIIVKAKLRGVIPSIVPLLTKIKETNFRLSTAIITYALKEAGEDL